MQSDKLVSVLNTLLSSIHNTIVWELGVEPTELEKQNILAELLDLGRDPLDVENEYIIQLFREEQNLTIAENK